jgi:hypothetical protein
MICVRFAANYQKVWFAPVKSEKPIGWFGPGWIWPIKSSTFWAHVGTPCSNQHHLVEI